VAKNALSSGTNYLVWQAGSGVRGARYLKQAGASHVWINDLNPRLLDTQVLNLLSPDFEAGKKIP
jgi:tRNA G26 N,N-dimethylase Trm1